MYSSQDLERFYFDYQTEWMPRGMSIQAYCSKNDVPYKVMDRWIRDIHSKVVPVEVTGKPEEEVPVPLIDKEPPPPARPRGRKRAEPEAPSITVSIRLASGVEVSQKGLDYTGLKLLVEKLEVLC